VRVVDPYCLDEARATIEEELAAPEVSVVVAQAPCLLGGRVPKQDPISIKLDECTRCGACIRVGCMALRERDGYPEVDCDLCTGCQVCLQACQTGAITSSLAMAMAGTVEE